MMAYAWLRQSVAADLEKARRQAVSDDSKVEFYSPPAVTHRVAISMHESSRHVTIRTVATAVDQGELELRPPP
jgi:hypothetical protein